jgi:long-chain acyl-CoA synthetase
MPVAAHVLRHASERPPRLAVCGPEGALTYAELARRFSGAARHLAGQGMGRGHLAAISLADPVETLVAVLAADLLGATPLVCDPTWDPGRRARVLDAISVNTLIDAPLPDTLLSDAPLSNVRLSDVRSRVGSLPDAGLSVLPVPGADGASVRFAALPEDRAWACFSSGSTGRPRAVVRTRASWTASFPYLNELAGIGPDDVVLVPGPLFSSLYGFAAVHALATGATAVVPGHWSDGSLAAQLQRATVVHLVPHQLPAVLQVLAEFGGRLRTAVVGAAALPPESRALAVDAGVRVVSYYGATELSFVAVDADGTGLRPFPGVEIEVRVAPGQMLGEVWVRSPWLSKGYLADASGPLRTDGDGWMTVGDVADPYQQGEALRLRGRGGGAIQIGGATVVPEDVEKVLRRAPGVGDIVVVGSPHPHLGAVVTAIVEPEGASPPSRAVLEAVARGGLDAAQRPRRWYAVESLPRTPAGKPERALAAARLASGGPDIQRLI